MKERIDDQVDQAPAQPSQRPRTEIRRAERRAWERGVDVPILLAHARGEEVDQAPRSLKAPLIRPVSTPPRPRNVNPDEALRPVRRVSEAEQEKPTIRIPSRTFPWQFEAVEAPYEVLRIGRAAITVVDMTSMGPLAGFSAKLTGDLPERADTLTRVSLEREFEEGLLFGGKILRPKHGGEGPIFSLATDGPNEARKVGVWRTRISQRRAIIVARSLYPDIEAVNRRLGFAGYVEPPPGSYGRK